MSDMEPLDMQDQQGLDGQLPGFPGYLLRQAREERGLSQMEAARDLHLTSKVINAIEEDNFELIPSFVFARGYIRSYARHVGLDGQSLVAAFDTVYGVPDHGAKPISGVGKGGLQSKPSDTWVKVISIVFVIGLLAASIVWWQSQNGSLTLPQLTSETVEAFSSDVVGGGDDNIDLALLSIAQSDVGETMPAEEAPPEVNAVAEVSTVAEVDVVAQDDKEQVSIAVADVDVLGPGQARLVMVFEKDCWVEIKDGNGKMILSDLYSAGDTIDQVVTSPIEVLLGRSSGVSTMTFGGKIIDLEPHTRKDIARVTLSK